MIESGEFGADSDQTDNDDEDEHDSGALEDLSHFAKLFVTFIEKSIDRLVAQLIEMRQECGPQILRG